MSTEHCKQQILAMAELRREEAIRPVEVRKAIGISTSYASTVLRDMARDKLLLKVGPERYRLATPARRWIADPWGRTTPSPQLFGPLEWSRGA